jgi:glycosyltransferase involved in cell wall biosynthesis
VADKNILFSLIIPTYNRGPYIVKAITSVLEQKFSSFELIIVDDGSTDDTERIVEAYKDVRLSYFKKTNGERGAARNFGVARSQGKYITFLDSDDFLKSDHFSVAKSVIESHQEIPVFHLGFDVVDEQGKVNKRWAPLLSPVNLKLVEGNFLGCLGIFLRRDVALLNTFNEDRDLSGSEDYELWLRVAARHPIICIGKSTACLVDHNNRSVVTTNPHKLETRIRLLKKYVYADDKAKNFLKVHRGRFEAFLDLYESLHLVIDRHYDLSKIFLRNASTKFRGIVFNYRYWVVVYKQLLRR